MLVDNISKGNCSSTPLSNEFTKNINYEKMFVNSANIANTMTQIFQQSPLANTNNKSITNNKSKIDDIDENNIIASENTKSNDKINNNNVTITNSTSNYVNSINQEKESNNRNDSSNASSITAAKDLIVNSLFPRDNSSTNKFTNYRHDAQLLILASKIHFTPQQMQKMNFLNLIERRDDN